MRNASSIFFTTFKFSFSNVKQAAEEVNSVTTGMSESATSTVLCCCRIVVMVCFPQSGSMPACPAILPRWWSIGISLRQVFCRVGCSGNDWQLSASLRHHCVPFLHLTEWTRFSTRMNEHATGWSVTAPCLLFAHSKKHCSRFWSAANYPSNSVSGSVWGGVKKATLSLHCHCKVLGFNSNPAHYCFYFACCHCVHTDFQNQNACY